MPKEIVVKSVLNKVKKRDSWFLCDYTVNLYSSCSFNCLYCYIRGSKYGTNLESSLSVKTNGIEILDRQLYNKAKKKQYGIIVLSSATDPYLQIEKEYELSREALKVILKHRFPVHIITKSNLIERDFDLLSQIDRQAILPNDLGHFNRGVIVSFSFSTLSDQVGKIFEPGATSPGLRLKTMALSVKTGLLTGVSMMPLLPFISDTSQHLDLLFQSFNNVGVHYILPATLTLFGNTKADSKTLVMNAINKHFSELMPRYQKYFASGSQMPAYYQKAFYHKMKELSEEYQIPDSISGAAQKIKE